jgi:hypothetical protein
VAARSAWFDHDARLQLDAPLLAVGIEGGDLAQGAATAIFLFPLLAGVAALILKVARRSEVT